MTVRPPLKYVPLKATHILGLIVCTTWPCRVRIGRCSRLLPPKKLLFGVKNHAPVAASTVHRPIGFETPISGLKDHRFEPILTSRFGSYCPVGAITLRLTPTSVVGLRTANSFGLRAGAPTSIVENRKRMSAPPERVTAVSCSNTRPFTCA